MPRCHCCSWRRLAFYSLPKDFPQQVMGAYARTSNLKCLTLNPPTCLLPFSDAKGPSVLYQLAVIISQVDEVLQGLGTAIRTVKTLNITFVKQLYSPKEKACGTTPTPLKQASFTLLQSTICSVLADMVPVLESLSFAGPCIDVALDTFSDLCPQLVHLKLEAISVAVGSIKNLGQLLPRLESFGLTPPSARPPHDHQLDHYVAACLQLLQECPLLIRLGLNLTSKSFNLESNPGTWMHVPEGILELTYRSPSGSISHCPALLTHLQRLVMCSISTPRTLHCLRYAPSLKSISTEGESLTKCDQEVELLDIPLLRERVDRDGFWLAAPFHRLNGTGENVEAVLNALPTLSSERKRVMRCTLEFSTPLGVHCMTHTARVFPYLTTLRLEALFPEVPSPGVDAALLAPLAACMVLSRLYVRTQVAHTTASMQSLCMSIPSLMMLKYMPTQDVDTVQLQAALKAGKHSVILISF